MPACPYLDIDIFLHLVSFILNMPMSVSMSAHRGTYMS